MEWLDIGHKRQTVSTGILRRKIDPLICCYIFLVIIKVCYGNMNGQTCIHTTCPSITKSAIEVIPRIWNAEIRSKPETKIWNLCVLESAICTGRIWEPAPVIRNVILSWITLHGAFSYLPLSEMGHMANKFSPQKSLFEVNLKQINSLVFRLTGSTTTASAFAIFEERSNLQLNCPMTSRHKIIMPRDTADSFVKS